MRQRADAAGVLLDLDGTLAEIVARPDLTRPIDGAREVLGGLVDRYRVVAVVTGRRSDEATALLEVPGVAFLGLYGLEDEAARLGADVLRHVEAAAAVVSDAWVEDKAGSVAVHYRQAPDPPSARAALLLALGGIAAATGLEVVEGKMVVELVPAGRPMKGGAVERLVATNGLEAALYAGDDHADLDAFAALDRLAARGVLGVRVAVRGPETPAALIEAADVVVEGPPGLLELLRGL